MRVLCAPDSYKEVLAAGAVAEAMIAGSMRRAGVMAPACPLADGGEGTLAVMCDARSTRAVTVRGPLGEPVAATLGVVERGGRRLAIVELAQASGLELVPPEQRDPTRTSTFGTGEMIMAGLDDRPDRMIVAVGGSATVDGGIGLLAALGTRFLDAAGHDLPGPLTGERMLDISRIVSPDHRLPPIDVLCDVDNPLLGPAGAVRTFGPQKGAKPDQIELLERAIAHFATMTDADPTTPGAGAAGGCAFGLHAVLGAELHRGAEYILNWLDFDGRCAEADLVLTGEGRIDGQTPRGKAAHAVARRAQRAGVRCIAICGDRGPDWEQCLAIHGGPLDAIIALTDEHDAAEARDNAPELIANAAERAVGTPG